MNKKIRIVIIIIMLGAVGVAALQYFDRPDPTPNPYKNIQSASPTNASVQNIKQVIFGDHTFNVLLADTDEKREQGLSGRVLLAEDTVMLFIFDRPQYTGFWMVDMNFAIDIVWLDENLKVVYIKKNARPEDYPEVYRPDIPALYVVEGVTGFTDKYGIQIGTEMGVI